MNLKRRIEKELMVRNTMALTKEWVSDPTEEAPNRWTHTATGEHRYQENKPNEQDGSSDEAGGRSSDSWDEEYADWVSGIVDKLEKPSNKSEAKRTKTKMFDELTKKYEDDAIRGMPRRNEANPEDLSIQSMTKFWQLGGYWSEAVEPLWNAAKEMTGRDADIPINIPDDSISGDNYHEDTKEALKDIISISQMFIEENYEDGKVSVSRGISEELAEKAIKAKENDEPLEVDPNAMESWSTDREYAESFGNVVLEKELEADEVALFTALLIPTEFKEKEITALGVSEYEINPESIEVLEE